MKINCTVQSCGRYFVPFFVSLFLLTIPFVEVVAQGAGAAYVHIASGSDFSFAIQSNGTLWAWGDNSFGELGDGTTNTRLQPVAIAEPIGAAMGSRWVRIFAQVPSTPVFGLRSDQTLWRWGANQTRPQQVPLNVSLPSGATLTDLAISTGHFLALYSDGSLFSWGSNSQGQLGIGTAAGTGTVPNPTAVITPPTAMAGTYWTAIEAKGNASFAIRSDGTLWSWGGVAVTVPSALGHPVTVAGCFTPEVVPHPISAVAGTGWASVKAGETHTLGLRTDGTLWAWGISNYGALGQGTGVTGTATPLQVGIPVGATPNAHWQQMQAGSQTSQGILTDGTLWTWGYNAFGQLGVNSNNVLEAFPQQEYNQEQWTQSALGVNHAVGLSRGRVYVTGSGAAGQLGLGNATSRLYFFVRVVGLPLTASTVKTYNVMSQLFPNPAAPGDNISVATSAVSSTRAEFLNAQGQTVGSCVVLHNHLTLHLVGPGFYLIRLYNGSQLVGLSKININ